MFQSRCTVLPMTQSPGPIQGPLQPQYPAPPPPEKKPLSKTKKVLIAVGGFVAFLIWASSCSAILDSDSSVTATPSPTVTVTASVGTAPAPTPSSSAPVVRKPPPTEKAPPPLTKAQEQAIGSAEDYLDTGHFSKKGLIKQLVYEGYSKADAAFAVDHIKVNWNEQAAGTAEDYLDTSHFSRKGLIDQLKYEGYTQSQAEYGAKKAGL